MNRSTSRCKRENRAIAPVLKFFDVVNGCFCGGTVIALIRGEIYTAVAFLTVAVFALQFRMFALDTEWEPFAVTNATDHPVAEGDSQLKNGPVGDSGASDCSCRN